VWFKGCDVAHDASTSFTAVPRAAVVAAAAAAASERVALGERERLGCIVMSGGWCPRNLRMDPVWTPYGVLYFWN